MRWIVATLALGGLLIAGSFFLPTSAKTDTAARKQVIAAATDFATTYNTYDSSDLTDYQKRVKGLLTPEYFDQFKQVTDSLFQVLGPKKQISKDAAVKAVAVGTIDSDSAIALVAVDATVTNTDVKDTAGITRRFRWKVTLSKEGDAWKVSNFESVAAVEATSAPTDGGDEK